MQDNINKKNVLRILGVVLALTLIAGVARGQQQQPSSKVTAQVGFINVMNEMSLFTNGTITGTGQWTDILRNSLKTPNQKDLFIGVSLEVGLLTQTLVKSKLGTTDTSLSSAGVEVRVLIDGVPALPGNVMFGRRSQTLTATLQGLIDGCMAVDTNTWSVVIDPNCVQPESLELILDTMNANAFNFIASDLQAGVHVIQVQARINLQAKAQTGSVRARALIGNGSLTVESVRMIRNEDIELP